MPAKKVLFVDERFYRFSHYYENEKWWASYNIKPTFKAYEGRNDKYKIYLSLVFDKPDYIVMVQLSTKNLILMMLANILGIKSIFWQHGFFTYPLKKQSFLQKIPIKLDYLLTLSEYDAIEISKLFTIVEDERIIKHYDLAQIDTIHRINKDGLIHIAYIGQHITREQVEASNSEIMKKYLGEEDYFKKILDSILENELPIKVLVKKHPGDKSNYLEDLCKEYDSMEMCNSNNIFSVDLAISHFSTMMLAFLQLQIPVLQLPMTNGKMFMNLDFYDNEDYLVKIYTNNDFLNFINNYDSTKYTKKEFNYKSISEELLRIINNED